MPGHEALSQGVRRDVLSLSETSVEKTQTLTFTVATMASKVAF